MWGQARCLGADGANRGTDTLSGSTRCRATGEGDEGATGSGARLSAEFAGNGFIAPRSLRCGCAGRWGERASYLVSVLCPCRFVVAGGLQVVYCCTNDMTVRVRVFVYGLAAAVAVVIAFNFQGRAAAPLNQAERLRRLARLPVVEPRSSLTFNPFNGYDLLHDKLAMRREAETMKLSLSESPANAMQYVRLGRLCREIGDSGTANVAFSTATRLFEQQNVESSVDGKILAAYGEAVAGAGRFDDAERVLRRSVRAAEPGWQTYAALGRFLTDRAVGSVMADGAFLVGPGHDLGWLGDRRGSSLFSERLERTQNQIGDAISALDRAIELAPEESELRVWRAAAKSARCYVETFSGAWEGGWQEPAKRLATLFPGEVTADLAEAARLSPTNARVLSMSAVYPVMSCYAALGSRGSGALALHEAWDSAPDDVRALVRHAMSRLDALAQLDEPRTAAAAMEMLGCIQLFVVRDTSGAEQNLRRASLLDSERGQAALAALLVDAGRWDELVALCEEELKKRDNVPGRLLFAKGLEKLGKLGAMAGVVLETHRRYPEDFNANVALALTLIRVSEEPVLLSQAVSLILRAEKAAGKTPSRYQVAELLFARGLVFALEDQVDQARSCFEKVIELDPGNREAIQALEIIDVGG